MIRSLPLSVLTQV